MSRWKEKDLKFILDLKYFPICPDCGKTYFHDGSCSHVTGKVSPKKMERINIELDRRLDEFEKKHGVDGCGISCHICDNVAVGEMHVLYHHSETTVEKWAVCMDHAFHEDSIGRESRFKGFKK